MPNAKEHFLTAACVGLAVDVIKQAIQMNLEPGRSFDWLELAAYGAAGGVIGLIPDLIEPAVTPDHRGFFHSVGCGTAVLYATHGPHARSWSHEQKAAAQLLGLCYLSHLAADATTPNGIGLL